MFFSFLPFELKSTNGFIFALMMILDVQKNLFHTNMNSNGGVQDSKFRSTGQHHPDPGVASDHQHGVKRLRRLLVCLGFYTTELGSPYTEVRGHCQLLFTSHCNHLFISH